MYYRFINCLLIIIVMVGCAKPNAVLQEFKTDPIIHFSQMKNVDCNFDYIVYLDRGDTIPLKVTLDSDVFNIKNEKIDLILKQKVYFRVITPNAINIKNKPVMSQEEKEQFLKNMVIYLSADAKSWAPYTNINAVKHLFGLKDGSFSFGMVITKEKGVTLLLIAYINNGS